MSEKLKEYVADFKQAEIDIATLKDEVVNGKKISEQAMQDLEKKLSETYTTKESQLIQNHDTKMSEVQNSNVELTERVTSQDKLLAVYLKINNELQNPEIDLGLVSAMYSHFRIQYGEHFDIELDGDQKSAYTSFLERQLAAHNEYNLEFERRAGGVGRGITKYPWVNLLFIKFFSINGSVSCSIFLSSIS